MSKEPDEEEPDEEESEERSKVKKEGPEMIIPQIHGPDEKLYTMPPESVEHFDQHHKNLIGSISARPGSDGLHISWKTAEYILDRSYETDSKEEDVESVLEDLTARIYRLLYDIAILSYGGYMDADTNWTSADGNCDHLNERDFFRTSYRSCFDNNIEIKYNNSSFNWGFDIGLALTSLTGPIAENIESSKFLSGLMTAYTADHVQSGPGYDIYNSVGGDQHWKNEYNSEKEVFKNMGWRIRTI